MTNSLLKPIPKKIKQVAKIFVQPIIPLWPRATWVPDMENSIGEKTRSLKLVLSTEPGNLNGKTLTKRFKIYHTGTPKDWIIWRQDFYAVILGRNISLGAAYNRMVLSIIV